VQDPSVVVALKAAPPEPHASSPARRGPVFAPILAGFDERNVSYKAAAKAMGNEKVGPWGMRRLDLEQSSIKSKKARACSLLLATLNVQTFNDYHRKARVESKTP
jgi:hypothetical protein